MNSADEKTVKSEPTFEMKNGLTALEEIIANLYDVPEQENEPPSWSKFDHNEAISIIANVSPVAVEMLSTQFMKELRNSKDDKGFAMIFKAAKTVCENVSEHVKGDVNNLREAVVLLSLSEAAHYHGYIMGNGDAVARAQPKHKQGKHKKHVFTPTHEIETP